MFKTFHDNICILFREVQVWMERVGLVTRLAIHIIVCPRESNSLHLTEKKNIEICNFCISTSEKYLLQKVLSSAETCGTLALELRELYPHSGEAESSGFVSNSFSVWSFKQSSQCPEVISRHWQKVKHRTKVLLALKTYFVIILLYRCYSEQRKCLDKDWIFWEKSNYLSKYCGMPMGHFFPTWL